MYVRYYKVLRNLLIYNIFNNVVISNNDYRILTLKIFSVKMKKLLELN